MKTVIHQVSQQDIDSIIHDCHTPKIVIGGEVITTGEGRIVATVVISCSVEPYLVGIGTASKCPKDPNAGQSETIRLAFYRALQQYARSMEKITVRRIEEYIKCFEFFNVRHPNDC
jgi:hypothetical protein